MNSRSHLSDRLAARMEVAQWRRRERLLSERATVLSVCSDADRRALKLKGPVRVIPQGFVKPSEEPLRTPIQPPRLGFIGLFDYPPNVEGIAWFLKYCWPIIRAQIPSVRLRLIGRGSDGPISKQAECVDGLGWVDDAAPEIGSWSAMIVPIHFGGGQRVKIPEGFSRRCPIVSTRLGAYGFDIENGRELLLADEPAAFAAACVELIRNPSDAAAMADRAFQAFLQRWTWEAITPMIGAVLSECLDRSRTSRKATS